MKKHISLLFGCLVALLATSCMNDFDDLTFEPGNYPYGNNNLNTGSIISIQTLKTKYKHTYPSGSYNLYEEVKDDVCIRGYIVTNDESGNVYKQLAIQDTTGCIVIGVNASGLYAYLPMGQEITLNLKGLCVGGYNGLAQIGVPYFSDNYGEYQIGRMSEQLFKEHVKLIGTPDTTAIQPKDINEAWLSNPSNKNDHTPLYVRFTNVTFSDGNGKTQFSPNDDETLNRNVYVGKQKVVFRMSSYANFAKEIIPEGPVNITGVITRYGSDWQCLLRVLDDIEPAAN